MLKKIFFIKIIFVIFTINFCYAASNDYAEKLKSKLDDAEKIAREEFDRLHNTVNNTKSPDERNIKGFVLSTEVKTFKDIPENIDKEISVIRERIRKLIFQVATDIETTGNSGKVKVSRGGNLDYKLPDDAAKRLKSIMSAKAKNNVSVRSIKVSIQLLAAVNNSLMEDAKKEKNESLKRRAYITQAAYVYEMSKIVLDVLNSIELEGKPVLEKLKIEQEKKLNLRISALKKSVGKVENSLNAGKIKEQQAERLKESYGHLLKANEIQLEAWDDLMQKIGKQEDWLKSIKSEKDVIELNMDFAKHQLNTIRDMQVLAETMSLVGNMGELIKIVENIELLELDDKTVQKLLFGGVE